MAELEDVPTTDIERGRKVIATGNNAHRHQLDIAGDDGNQLRESEAANALRVLRSQVRRLLDEKRGLDQRVESLIKENRTQAQNLARIEQQCALLHQQLPDLKRKLARCRCGAAGDGEP